MPKTTVEKRKQKPVKKDKSREHGLDLVNDSNVIELHPLSKADKEQKRRQLEAELRAQQPKISREKQKRLNKYIETKLRKDENLELLKRLAQAKVDTSLLQSSKKLGTKRESKREILSRALREREAGVNVELNNQTLLEERRVSEKEDVESIKEQLEANTAEEKVTQHQNYTYETQKEDIAVGSGLKRPLEVDGNGNPIIPRRKRRKVAIPKLQEEFCDSTWEGFVSETGSASTGGAHSEHILETDPAAASHSGELGESSPLSDDAESDSLSRSSSLSDEDEGEDEITQEDSSRKERISAFKAWANQQRNEVLGFQPSALSEHDQTHLANGSNISFQPRQPEADPLLPELEIKPSDRKAFNIQVDRTPEVVTSRLALPVVREEQRIMEAIHNNPVVVLCGETGSGKTTQIPQFLFEAGYGSSESSTPGMIGITQPRRVAAVSMAKRVGEELGIHADRVAYKIRFEGSVKPKTAIKFMTDGILLREASNDILLSKYSAIIIDEAHERTKDTDILIGMMSKIVKLRESLSRENSNVKPLKLIIMSATLSIHDFTGNKSLFQPTPPVVQIEGRQHPVTVHWSRKTSHNYLDEMYRKLIKGHQRLPPGGILVFLTGQNEISTLSKRLRQSCNAVNEGEPVTGPAVRISGNEAPLETEDVDLGPSDTQRNASDPENELSGDESGSDRGDDDEFNIETSAEPTLSMHILPLYSLLPTSEQLRVFEAPPDGSRLVVLATNIAETSLTIPGIRYVFDCGRAKDRRYDDITGVQSFEVGWISKASASQRAGRAGRTGPGHCYRLYSSAVYERDFEEFTQPEIMRTPLEGVVLQLSGLGVPNILQKFPFPTPPDPQRLSMARNLLAYLGAITKSSQVTDVGRKMSALPLLPRFSKILLTGHYHSCLPYTVALVAALSVPNVFITEGQLDIIKRPASQEEEVFTNAERLEEDARTARRKAFNSAQARLSKLGGNSDVLKLLAAVLYHAASSEPNMFCTEHFLRPKAMREVQLLRHQLTSLLCADSRYSSSLPPSTKRLARPSEKQVRYLRQVAAAGFIDQVAIRADQAPTPPEEQRKPRRATDVKYLSLFPSYLHREEDRAVYIHPSSVLARIPPADMPTYVVYSSLQRSTNSSKVRMMPLTPLSAPQLYLLTKGTPLQSLGKPIKEVVLDTEEGLKRERWVVPALQGPAGSQSWPLPAQKIVQRKVDGTWVDD